MKTYSVECRKDADVKNSEISKRKGILYLKFIITKTQSQSKSNKHMHY